VARQREVGRPGAAAEALDGDMLVAAQALAENATVVTANPRHFDGLVSALQWNEVPLE
jgi:predicted nucleic acid-binding protein